LESDNLFLEWKPKNRFDLQNKVAVVTGASGFLGRHFCAGLAACGAALALIDVNQKKVEDLSALLQTRFQTQVIWYACDVSSEKSVKKTIDNIKKDFNGIDVLLNNAATKTLDVSEFVKTFENSDMETWTEVMSVNLGGMYNMAKHVGKAMIENGGGTVIQIASIYGVNAPDQRIYEDSQNAGIPIGTPAVYSASKAGVIGLTRYLSAYWGDSNIRVNSISPGGVEENQDENFKQNYSQRVPMRRMANPWEIVEPMLFLASSASSYITGHNMIVDGGLTAW